MAEEHPQSPEASGAYDEGNGFFATGDIEGAIAAYRKSVALDPSFFDGWHALGMALLKAGEVKEAIAVPNYLSSQGENARSPLGVLSLRDLSVLDVHL